tara:strand:- start:1237 stop:1461 length:225 start_codon:yes stop_codon:yes gene_type:complete
MGNKRPVIVEVRAKYLDEPIERMIKRFSKKVKKQRIKEGCVERRRFTKPSDERRLQKKRRKKILQKLQSTKKRF